MSLSHRTLVRVLVMQTLGVAAVLLIGSLMVAGHGKHGGGNALALAVPFIALYATAGLAMYLVAARLLRNGDDKRAMLYLCAYACLPWPMIAIALY